MNARQGLVLIVGFSGFVATLGVYVVLLLVQIINADNACESPTASVPGTEFSEIRGIGFENTFLNLGGRCTYRLDDGPVVVTREPGWWFSGTIAGLAAGLAVLAVVVARRKGHFGLLFGVATFFAPPMGLALAFAAPRRGSSRGLIAL